MIEKSHGNKRSPYRKVFFACRSAIRSHAGIGVIEFILPLLVLDVIVFGDEIGNAVTINEMSGLLTLHELTEIPKMSDVELLKAVGCIFTILDTLQIWCNTGVEYQYRSLTSPASDHSVESIQSANSLWSANNCIHAIVKLLDAIPLSLRAKAAASVGMHARSLLLLEMDGRSQSSADFDGNVGSEKTLPRDRKRILEAKKLTIAKRHINNIDLSLMQFILGELNDLDSMSALAQYRDRNGLTRTYSDKVHEKEYNDDFDGVIQVYEQATQIGLHTAESKNTLIQSVHNSLNASYVRALLKMGRLESAQLHVQAILTTDYKSDKINLIPSAIEASWRLCRWEQLDQLLKSNSRQGSGVESRTGIFDNNISRYQMFCGKALLGIYKNDKDIVRVALEESRNAVMSALAIAARDNYSRAYPYLITLHSMTEIEEAAHLLCGDNCQSASMKFADRAVSDSFPGWNWEGRLDLTGHDAEAALPLLNVRVSLSRLAAAKEVEAKLWLDIGKLARKCGQANIAVDALTHAEVLHGFLIENYTMYDGDVGLRRLKVSANECRLQFAKIMYASGKSSVALQMLEDETFQRLQLISQGELNKEIQKAPLRDDIEVVSRRALQLTEWMIDGGFKNASEVIARYRLLRKLVPTWEKGKHSKLQTLSLIMGHFSNAVYFICVIRE